MGKLYDRHNRMAGYWEDNVVYDRHHRIKGYIQDNMLLDASGNPLSYVYNDAFYNMNGIPWGYYDGRVLRDMSGRRLGSAGKGWPGLLSSALLFGEGIGWYIPDYEDNAAVDVRGRREPTRYVQENNDPPARRVNAPRRPVANANAGQTNAPQPQGAVPAGNGLSNSGTAKGGLSLPLLGNLNVGGSMQNAMKIGRNVLSTVGEFGGQNSTPFGGFKVIGNLAGRYIMSNPQALFSIIGRISSMGLLRR
ncbi:MAG: hypothetical protein Q8930_06995 [Bacillota bacterium]|nr:hypothetical protein [Bacillota bacterium]